MDLRDRLALTFASSPALKALAYLLCLGAGLALSLRFGAALLALPLAADVYGAALLRRLYDGFREDLLEVLETEARRECGLTPEDDVYPVWEYSGCLDHWLARRLPDTLLLTLLAPRRDFLVLARKQGRIFPPLSFAPLEYLVEDAGSLDIYYRDITHAELKDQVIALHLSGGEAIEYEDHSGSGGEAVRVLRERLREHKSRIGERA